MLMFINHHPFFNLHAIDAPRRCSLGNISKKVAYGLYWGQLLSYHRKMKLWHLSLLLIVLGMMNACLLLANEFDPAFPFFKYALMVDTLFAPSALMALAAWGLWGWWKHRAQKMTGIAWSISAALALLLIILRIHVQFVEPNRLVVREIVLYSHKVAQPLHILHFSDLQSPALGAHEARIFEAIQKLKPDLIIHTGDLLQPQPPASYESETPKLVRLLATMSAPCGLFGVVGNIDTPLRSKSSACLGGLVLLENETARIPFATGFISIHGLSCELSGNPRRASGHMQRWLNNAGTNAFTILLGHSPDFAVAAQHLPIDLCLAGHTHGGQLRLPWLGPLVTSTTFIPRAWAMGFREMGHAKLNVSAGVGCEHADGLPSVRLNCPSEMSLIKVLPAKAGT